MVKYYKDGDRVFAEKGDQLFELVDGVYGPIGGSLITLSKFLPSINIS